MAFPCNDDMRRAVLETLYTDGACSMNILLKKMTQHFSMSAEELNMVAPDGQMFVFQGILFDAIRELTAISWIAKDVSRGYFLTQTGQSECDRSFPDICAQKAIAAERDPQMKIIKQIDFISKRIARSDAEPTLQAQLDSLKCLQRFFQSVDRKNYELRLEPHLKLLGKNDMLAELNRLDIKLVGDLCVPVPEISRSDILRLAEYFAESLRKKYESFLSGLDMSNTSTDAWAARRVAFPVELVPAIDAYIDSVPASGSRWAKFLAAFGDQYAAVYAMYAYPSTIPKTKKDSYERFAYQPETASFAEALKYVYLTMLQNDPSALKWMRAIRECRFRMGIDTPLLQDRNYLSNYPERRKQFSEERIPIQGTQYAYRIDWNAKSIARLAKEAGDFAWEVFSIENLKRWNIY